MSYNYEYLALGVLLMAMGLFSLLRGKKKRSRCSASVTATVTEVEKQRSTRFDKTDPDKRNIFFPTLSYTVDGKSYTHKYEYPHKHDNEPHEGDEVTIWYDPADPEQICTELEYSYIHKRNIIITLIGAAICIVTLSFMLRMPIIARP